MMMATNIHSSIFVQQRTHAQQMCGIEQPQQQQPPQQRKLFSMSSLLSSSSSSSSTLSPSSSPFVALLPSRSSSTSSLASSASSSSNASSVPSTTSSTSSSLAFSTPPPQSPFASPFLPRATIATFTSINAANIVHKPQPQQQQPPPPPSSGVSHLPNANRTAVQTNNIPTNNKNNNHSLTVESTTTASSSIVPNSNAAGLFISTLMPLYERVKGFFVQLVLGGTSAGGGGSSIGCIQTMPTTKASSPVSHNEHKQQQHRHHHSSSDSEYFDIDDDDDDFSSAEYEHIFAHAAGLGLAGFAATAAANLLFGGADDKSHSVFAASPQRHHLRPQPTVSLQASLLELLAMETSPTRQSGGGGGGSAPATVCNDIGAAVDRYLSVLARGPAKPPASRQSLNEPQFVQTSATSLPVLLNQSLKEFAPDDSRLAPKKPLKRKHYLRSTTSPSKAMAASNQQQHASSSGSSSTSPWSRLNNAPDAASGSSPPTTMKSLSTLLNAKPIKSAHTNKNRREKERQTLTRYIHDDLNEEAKRKWRTDDDDDGDGDDDDAVAGAVGHDADTVDCAFFTLPCTAIRQSVPDVLQMAADAAVAMSIGCRLSPEDFPAIPGPKKSSSTFTATTTKSKVVLEDSAAMHIESASVTITVTASTTPARSQKPAISWEISVDELRSPAKRPAHASRQQRRDNDAAAAAMPLTSDQQHGTSSNQPQPQQQQCLLKMLLGIRPRERQISECSDDFICFEKDSSEGSICYDVADDDDSSEFETDDDDDADDTDDDVDDDDDEETEADDDNNDADDTKAEIKTNAVTDTDSESDSESESEANSGTQQPDSGFEEKKGNKVRFAAVDRVHYIRAWSFAYQQARKSHWEQIGRDRVRFADRCRRLQDTLNPVLEAEHRERVWQRLHGDADDKPMMSR